MKNFLTEAQALADDLIAFRHDLHQHPEVGMDLPRTTSQITDALTKAGISFTSPIPSSILAVIEGGKPGKTLLLRADMDALPIQEDSGVPYASKQAGKMHACGHDIHATMLLGAALLLKKHQADLPGTLKLLWQPGEEIFSGMKPLVEAGILTNPQVDAAYDMHVDVTSPVGTIGYSDAAFTTAATNFSIDIQGTGGHGAFPHTTTDPVNVAVQIYQAIQAMQTREISPADYLALSLCSIQAGDTYNIIPHTARLMGTMRSYDKEVHQKALDRIAELVQTTADSFHAKASLQFAVNVPAITSDVQMAEAAGNYLASFPMDLDIHKGGRISASDDFGFVSEQVPSLMLMLGCKPEGVEHNNFHNPHVVMDDQVIPLGAALWCHLAYNWLNDQVVSN